jgi:peptidoglycan/xylan/chitin deacetylase (PgdA/CDA1 family)
VKKKLLKTIYSIGGFTPFHFLNRREVLILTYHRFSKQPDLLTIAESEFEDHLVYLKNNCNIISLAEAVRLFETGEEPAANTVVITIDDGYRDAYEIAFPVLKKHGMPATLFVITDFIDGKIWLWTDLMRFALLNTDKTSIDITFGELGNVSGELQDKDSRIRLAGALNDRLKLLPDDEKNAKIDEIAGGLNVVLDSSPPAEYGPVTWDQAREMERDGIQIECHTVTHPIMTNIDDVRLENELSDSKRVISERIGKDVNHFCYPNGSFDKRVRDAVAAAGFKSAVTTKYGFCDRSDDQFSLRRMDGQPSIVQFAQSVSGFESFREKIGL